MLFFYFLAALNDAPGWMLFWAVLGLIASERPSRYFLLPALVALMEDPHLGVVTVVCTWVYLTWRSGNEAADRAAARRKNEGLIQQAHTSVENALHQPSKPGA